ncbi:MAG: CAP domain-containing protein [Planctomycetota bacterium]
MLAFASVFIIGAAVAQEKPAPAPEPEEAATLALGARELDTFASLALKNGFPVRAKQAWLEVLAEYAPDDEDTRKALGWYRHGSIWQRDPKFQFPDQDTPNVAAARMLEQRWNSVAQKLGDAHRTLSIQLGTAGKKERSEYHGKRALRFVPNDPKAMAQVGLRQLEGITGDDIDLAVLQRSRAMDRAITRLSAQAYPAKPSDEKLPILEGLVPGYRAVQSENFYVFGDLDEAVLATAAAWAERSLAFCQEAFAGFEGFPPRDQSRKLVFLSKKEQWDAVVRKHSKGNDVEFTIANTRGSEIDLVETACHDQPESINDLAVRWVAQDYSGMTLPALEEGIGHAIVGMFFGRNLWFSVGKEDPKGTVAGPREQKKSALPDMDTWRELAIEQAWQKGGLAAARLPLLKGADLTTDARIKAWSFCDYLLRRDPALLRQLARTPQKARTENEVLGAFQEFAGQSLYHVEDRWRRFWTEDSPLRRAVLQKTTPLDAASKEAPVWLDLFNKLRVQFLGADKTVGWSAQLSIPCKEHADYLRANKDQRGPDKEHVQQPGKPGFSNAGRTFAPAAVVWTKDQKKAAESWMLLPGYRDAILNGNIDTVGIYAEGGIVVLDALRGRAVADKVITHVWPAANVQGGRARDPVPGSVEVELLGGEVQRLLAEHKRGKQKEVGLPLTLHCYHGANVTEATCKVTIRGEAVPGVLVRTSGTCRRTSAQGLWVFWPFDPLPRGVDITAEWTWTSGTHKVTFVAQ